MRNFKKFLALVLAVLMVSACAVSVSAFNDQGAVNASKYAEAINKLADLKVIVGDGNGNFNPANTLRRDEAAVIFAKLAAGVDGWITEWDAQETCYYDDVTAKWSFAYINYVTDHDLMQGKGDNMFAPEDTITLAEVLTIAVREYEDAFDAYLDFEADNPGAKWYTNYMKAARKFGLTDKLGTSDYEANATKAQLAQVAYNLYKQEATGVAANFKYEKTTGAVTYDANYVYVGGASPVKFTLAAFAEEAAKYGINPDYKALAVDGTKLYVEHKQAATKVNVYDMAVAVTYDDVTVAQAPKESDKYVSKIIVNGTTYATVDGLGADIHVVGGHGAMGAVSVTLDGEAYLNGPLPQFYTATASDEDGNGAIDAVQIVSYYLGTINKANDQIAKDKAVVDAAIDNIVITGEKNFNNATDNLVNGKSRSVTFTGEAFTFSGETPVVYRVTMNDNDNTAVVDVLKVANTVTGKLTAFSNSDKYIMVDAQKYGFLNDSVTKPDAWTLNQTVSFYEIDGKYIKVTSASSSEVSLYIEDVTVKSGVAVVTGYKTSDFSKVTLNVNGYSDGKLYAAYAVQAKLADKKTDAYVQLNKKADGKADDANMIVEFVEGNAYTFKVTTDGVYYVSTGANIASIVSTFDKATLAVDGGYVKVNGVSAKKFAGVVITRSYNSEKAGTYAEYTCKIENSYAKRADVEYALVLKADDANTATVVWINKNGTAEKTYIKALPSGYTFVQVISDLKEAGYDYAIYTAVDLFTGKQVDVTTASSAAKGAYYIVKNGTIVTDLGYDAAKWLVSNKINVALEGLIYKYSATEAKMIEVTEDKDGKPVYTLVKNTAKNAAVYGLDNITVYNADKDGIITVKDGAAVKPADLAKYLNAIEGSKSYATAYAVAGKLIVVDVADAPDEPAQPTDDEKIAAAKAEVLAANDDLTAAKAAYALAQIADAEAAAKVAAFVKDEALLADYADAEKIETAKAAIDALAEDATDAEKDAAKALLAAAVEHAIANVAIEDIEGDKAFFTESLVKAYLTAKEELALADEATKEEKQTAYDSALNALAADAMSLKDAKEAVDAFEAENAALLTGTAAKAAAALAEADKALAEAEKALKAAEKAYDAKLAAYNALLA